YPVRISLSHARSTNDEAVRLIASGQNPPFLVHAWAQTHGRGKLDRVWQGGAGVLTASWVYQFPKSYVGYDVVGLAGIVSALSVTDAVKELCESSRQVQVKWPNDVLIDGKKVSGILIEIREGQEHFDVIAGIGVNVSRIPALTDLTVYSLPPTSIFDNYNDDDMREAQIDKTILKITEKLRIRLNALLTDRTLGAQRDDWQKLDSLNGKTIKISTPQNSYPLVANYAGINDKGQLVAEFKGGRSKAFFSADVVKIEDNDAALSELKEQAGQIQSKITETADGKYVLSSPITGTVHAILVSVGQRVQQGDILIYIEAMKSMLPLESEVAGTVSSIFTAEGDAIEFGDAILLIDVS
ncbi:MAG TPA: biotin--[acetyl-CoA-carboxylase] ligase, partial [Pyrinomonadaceae bacterium]|nr:biotin--[acetyl-CoA-carboxylase] ligase [Pyrinomonadaceae bacterium]